jgi:hypothetical protein
MCKTWEDPFLDRHQNGKYSKIRISIKTMLIHNADHITRQNNTLKVTLLDNVRFLVA